MPLFATPGIYRQTVEPAYRPGPLARGDIAVFPGYALRGPVNAPVRLQSLLQFEDVFGPALAGGHLWHALKGFFECGGVAAYAIRVADGTGQAARAVLGDPAATPHWTAEASFPWPMLDPARVNRASRPDLAVWQALVDAHIREQPRLPDTGTWANGMAVAVSPASLAVTASSGEVLEGGQALRLASIAGIEPASLLRLIQREDGTASRAALVALAGVEPAQRLVRLARALPPAFDPGRPIQVASVEFDITVVQGGRILEAFKALSPEPRHSRALVTVLPRDCRNLTLIPPAGVHDWTDAASHPQAGIWQLSGGTAGLDAVSAQSWQAALSAIRHLSDAAIIAAPDLVLSNALPEAAAPAPGLVRPCSDLADRPAGFLSGQVLDAASGRPLAKVAIDVAGADGATVTDAEGQFNLGAVPLGFVDLRLSRPGHEVLEITAQTAAFEGLARITAFMTALTRLPELDADAVLSIQQAMGDPELVGPWKIAFLDPPADLLDADRLRSRAAQLGPDPRLGFFAPWIEVPDAASADGRRAMPASAHIAGAFARAELAGGLFRTGANLALRYADGVAFAIDDAMQAGLNPAGVNAIRAFPGRGIRAFGARSLAVGTEWQYLSARRIIDAIEKTLQIALSRLIFEPNSPFLRHTALAATASFLDQLWRAGHLTGDTPAAAFRVTCDDSNNTEATQAGGQLVLEVAVAPVIPFEFIIFRISHAFDAVTITEAG